MSKKQQDNSQLIAQLDTLSNKELHNKCVEYGMNVPVADSSRDVIIRKLVKSITGTAVASPKASKKQAHVPASPSERRKTVNLTVHVSDDDENEAKQQLRTTGRGAAATKAKPRTQSPKSTHVNVSSTTTNRRSVAAPAVTSTTTIAAASVGRKQHEARTINSMRADSNANVNTGGSVTRIVPMEVEFANNMERADYSFEVKRSDSGNRFASSSGNNRDDNFNQEFGSNRLYNPTYPSAASTLASSAATSYQSLASTSLPQHTVQPRSSFLSGYTQPLLNYQQEQLQQQQQQRQRDLSPTSPQQSFTGYNRPIGFSGTGEPKNSFSRENTASHSSSLTGVGMRNTYDGVTTTTIGATQEPVFKLPAALTKTSVTTASYNQEDAKRIYPRLPTEINTPYISSSAATAPEQLASRNTRAPSLSKSGVLTTSYHQEMTPLGEVKHRDVECEQDEFEADVDDTEMDTGLDYEYNSSPSGYDRGQYLATTQRRSEQLPFEPRLQSTFRGNLNASTRYSEPLAKPKLSPTLNAAYKTNYTPPRASASPHTNYTNSVDEPDSPSEDEQSSAHESDVDEYVAGMKKIYSSYGSNKFQERVPYRRSNAANLSGSSANAATRYGAYNESARRHTQHDDDDDVNATFVNFLNTLDRKYHIRQWFYMFLLFTAAVFVYVFFVQPDDAAIPMHLQKTHK